jgi:hypothetical protein
MSNRAMSLVPEPTTSPDGPGPQRQVTAIQLMLGRTDRLGANYSARSKKWNKAIGEAETALDTVIKQPNPQKKDALDRLHAIQAAHAEVASRKTQKSDELGILAPLLKHAEQAFREVCQKRDDEGVQTGLDFGDFGDGLSWTPGTLELIDAEARMIITAQGASAPADVVELATALASMGISGEKFVTVASDAVETDEDGVDMSDEGGGGEDDDGITF